MPGLSGLFLAARVLPIAIGITSAERVKAILKEENIRVELDQRREKSTIKSGKLRPKIPLLW